MNYKLLSLIIVFFTIGLQQKALGQSEDQKLIILSTTGTVLYAADDTNELQLLPGMNINNTGSIFLDEDARVRLIVKKKSVLLTGPGRYAVPDIYKSNTEASMSFSARFWNFVTDGMGNTENKKDLVKYHREYMKVHGGVKGYASMDSSILLTSPLSGYLTASDVTFEWSSEKSRSFRINLMDASRTVIHTATTLNKETDIELGELDLQVGSEYFWQITDASDEAIKSESSFIFQGDVDAERAISEKLFYLQDYMESNEIEKKWMTAVILEMEDYNHSADQIYKGLIKNEPDNLFYQKNYALFLARQNRIHKANALLN